ncbi:MAG: AAA family ATPase [Proteobacteria bacterium]|nr:AAA family ATPase [Pseudomonadota bacterium]
MYTSYFGLKENPFNLTPDPKYLFLGPQHREALNHLIYGINEKKGFIVITGGIGTGKTTICRTLLSALDQSIASALIFNSFISDNELLQTINQEFGITLSGEGETKKRYIDALNEFLLKNFASGRNAVILIDEAQNLSLSVMEQIRMLSNLETEREKLLQIVLIGQPELQELLTLTSLKQLNERITVRHDLKPLNQEQVQNYVEHRLTVAGGNNEHLNFSHGAYKVIYDYSKGIPRRINAICDRALLIAYSRDTSGIDKKTIKDAVGDIGGNYLTPDEGKRRWLLFSLILLLFGILAVGGMIYRDEIFKFLSALIF